MICKAESQESATVASGGHFVDARVRTVSKRFVVCGVDRRDCSLLNKRPSEAARCLDSPNLLVVEIAAECGDESAAAGCGNRVLPRQAHVQGSDEQTRTLTVLFSVAPTERAQ